MLQIFKKISPPNLNVKIYDLSVQSVRDRINLLIKNGLGGLVLVVIILFLFLSGRVAFWVAFGIPIALAGTLRGNAYIRPDNKYG